jgi:NAD-dependent dihydropyrimidine dehydrogenase PreA subunit/flavodoxin
MINAMYFSPTGTTKTVVHLIAEKISKKLPCMAPVKYIDFTLPKIRKKLFYFEEEDIVILGVPVYAGRVPNILLKFLNTVRSNKSLAVAVVLFGNRNYDDALLELIDILKSGGFRVIAGAAFIGEHSFSNILAKNRPDEKDLAVAENFADQIYIKITSKEKFHSIDVKGNKPYRKYYVPKDKDGHPVDFRKIIPKTNDNCIDCKLCADICPMGSIDVQNVSKLIGICIKCGACVKRCPSKAKYFDDNIYLRHKQELEIDYMKRKEPELFI